MELEELSSLFEEDDDDEEDDDAGVAGSGVLEKTGSGGLTV